jgi:hypothetical protein
MINEVLMGAPARHPSKAARRKTPAPGPGLLSSGEERNIEKKLHFC